MNVVHRLHQEECTRSSREHFPCEYRFRWGYGNPPLATNRFGRNNRYITGFQILTNNTNLTLSTLYSLSLATNNIIDTKQNPTTGSYNPMKQQWYHSKRSHQNTFHQNQHHHDRRHHEQEETMDDLLVAAEYAVIRPWNTTASAAVTAVTTNTTGNGNTGTADTSRRRALNTGNITSTDTATKCQATEDEPTGMEIDRDSAEIDLSDSCLVTGDESIDPDRSTNGTEPPATDRNGEEGTKNSPTCGTMPLNSSETDTIDENNVGQHINVREDSTNAGYLDRNSSDDHDDDDESEVDLETELQRMTHADAEEESPLDAPTKLKTVHEIDPYQDNFEQLRKSELPVDVNLPEQERLLNAAKPPWTVPVRSNTIWHPSEPSLFSVKPEGQC